jgi:hypothetical protein
MMSAEPAGMVHRTSHHLRCELPPVSTANNSPSPPPPHVGCYHSCLPNSPAQDVSPNDEVGEWDKVCPMSHFLFAFFVCGSGPTRTRCAVRLTLLVDQRRSEADATRGKGPIDPMYARKHAAKPARRWSRSAGEKQRETTHTDLSEILHHHQSSPSLLSITPLILLPSFLTEPPRRQIPPDPRTLHTPAPINNSLPADVWQSKSLPVEGALTCSVCALNNTHHTSASWALHATLPICTAGNQHTKTNRFG